MKNSKIFERIEKDFFFFVYHFFLSDIVENSCNLHVKKQMKNNKVLKFEF